MSKSTPINQLPSSTVLPQVTPQQHVFGANTVDGQQRQQAVQQFIMPQNTQASSDVPNEDDQTVLEALQQLGAPQTTVNQQAILQQSESYTPSNTQPTSTYMQGPIVQPIQPPGMFSDTPTNNYFQSMPAPIPDSAEMFQTNALNDLAKFNGDMKNVVLVMVVFVLVSVMPIERFVYNYIALDRIPYSRIAIKAAIAGILFFVLSKLLYHST